MGKVKRLELWWQLYPYVTSGLGLRKNPPLIYCATECTYLYMFLYVRNSQVVLNLVISASSFVTATVPLWTVWQVLCFWVFAFQIRYVVCACAALSSRIIITTFLTLYTTASAPDFSSVCIRLLCPIVKCTGQINPSIWSACVGKSVAVPI
jgi:hypothetical protein